MSTVGIAIATIPVKKATAGDAPPPPPVGELKAAAGAADNPTTADNDGLPSDECKPAAAAAASNNSSRAVPKVVFSPKTKSGKPPAKSTRPKNPRRSAKKAPAKSSAAKTIAKAKDAGHGAANDSGAESSSSESTSRAIPFSVLEFPQLALEGGGDHRGLAAAFAGPLFRSPSRALEIAYSWRSAAGARRGRAQGRKNAVLREYDRLRERFLRKKLELSLANDEVKAHAQTAGEWTRKVFDLELQEDCAWNANYKKLKGYVEANGRLPQNAKKAADEEEKSLSSWLDRVRNQKTHEDKDAESYEETGKRKHGQIGRKSTSDSPHRIEALAELGVVWENHNECKWETMFQRLLVYREEMGTLRFPSEDQCAATGDEELIALQKWVKGQVLNFRYGKRRNPETTKRLTDIGFDFGKWYAKPCRGHRRKANKKKEEKVAAEEVDDADTGMLEQEDIGEPTDVKMPAIDEVEDVEMKVDIQNLKN